ncbi:MAG TPA: multidrug effflux MFS transporter [Novosphingobium sp.]|nr:multidrug effflux MFS transporter [Novosphingobium sp.]
MALSSEARPAQPFPIGKRELVAMLALAQALQALAIDSMLPGLAYIAADLGVSDPNRRQLVVGVFLIGVGCGALFPGTLADRFGRKPILLGTIVAYAVLCAACSVAQDFTILIVFRFLCGLLSGGLAALGSAIIRDRFEGDRMASLQSLIFTVFMVVPILAPTIGQAMLLLGGWRWIFGGMAIMGFAMAIWVSLRLPETLDPANRQPITISRIFGSTGEVLLCRPSIGYVIAGALIMGVMWGYIQSCQQLLGEHFGAGAAFPIVFGGMATFLAAGNFGNSRLVMRFGARRTGHTGLLLYALTAFAQYLLAHTGHETLWQFIPLMALNMLFGSFIGANFASISLQPFAHIAGAAASLQLFLRTITASLIGAAIGQAYDQSARPLSSAMVLCSLTALGLVLFSERGRLFRRLNPPHAPLPHP